MSINVKQNGELTKIAGLYQTTAPVGMADCYSTEEKIIGCWTDGKPLYQKTIITPFSDKAKGSRSRVDILDRNQGIEPKIILGTITVDGYATFNMNGVGHDFADASTNNYAYATYTYTSTGAVSVVLRQYFYDGAASGYFTTTIQYTKTTDTPGSGQWTPSGDMAKHYSTEEQVIGTWIDGSTLYETTINWPSVTAGGNTLITLAHGIPNIAKVINFDFTFGSNAYKFKSIPLTDPAWFAMVSAVTTSSVQYRLGTSYNSYGLTITIQYIKTSD